jgi:hypothetical protein
MGTTATHTRNIRMKIFWLMETGILTQTMHLKVRHIRLKMWVFAASNGAKKLSPPLLSRFRVMHQMNITTQFYEISVKKLLAEGLDEKAADEITISVWEQLPNPNIRNCVQIGRLVKNEPDIEIAIADEIQNFIEYSKQLCCTIHLFLRLYLSVYKSRSWNSKHMFIFRFRRYGPDTSLRHYFKKYTDEDDCYY